MTKKQLDELRKEKEAEMASMIEQRSDSMDQEALDAVKDIKAEIEDIDRKLEAIDELRSVARKEAKPEEAKKDAEKEHRALFTKYLKGEISTKEFEQRANSVAANGDVVPEDFYRQLLEAINEYGMISGDATHIQTADNGELSIPVINDTANSGVWTQELGAIPLSDFTTSTITMNSFKCASGIEVSTELIEDSFFDVSGYVAKALGTRLGRTLENAYIKGDGTAKPLGIIEDTRTVEVTTDAAGVVSSEDLLNMIHALPPTQRIGATFYVSDDVLKALLHEKDADGRPLLQRSADATVANDVQYTIAGYPVKANYELEAIASGNTVAIFGNTKNYFIRDVRNVTIKRDDYTGMGEDAVKFFGTVRVDGKVAAANTVFAKLVVSA